MTAPLDRGLFAVSENYRYLNHAAVGILPAPTRAALHGFIDAHATGGIALLWPYEERIPACRDRIAAFIGAERGTIATMRNTGDGANVIARGFPWQSGDEIILPDNEFPANAQPWLPLRDTGVKVRFSETARSRLTPDVLREMMTPRTKVVTVSWVSFADGYRHDLEALAQVAHERGAMFCVDAIQGLGAFPLDVRACGIDALYCGGAKWLMALQGVSFLYVAPEWLDRIALALPGWRSVSNMWDFLKYEQAPAPDATRFEGGTPNFIGVHSLAESMNVLHEAGTGRIARHVLGLTDRLCDGLTAQGAEIASVRSASESSGIVTFRIPGNDPVSLGKALQARGIVTTYRASGVRVAPHGYNVEEDIDALLQGVSDFRKDRQYV
ncbi:MAG TPA: aminotransferase class V-fold PLP-dependent enzyme [Candidatus Baltobacteraceae bacterium]|nr:aminotransferase class V-fold PLP-dependent enzyme [Candidatus Baltobacteraceae bacterium]